MSKIEVNTIEPQCGTTLTVGAVGTTVTVPSNVVKSNALQASDAGNIISQSGTAITLGASGDSINLASGATQSGFGRTGTVDWDTTPKTSTVTAANGVGYFVNTTAGAITVNLPVGVAGNIVAVADYANTADTNKIVIVANGTEKIQGVASNSFEITIEGGSVTLVYVDSTQGWRPTDASTAASITESNVFITATGGTITCCGDYKIHTFTGPGTFCVSAAGGPVAKADYMVIAGGGGGGPDHGGSGGAGGYRESYCATTSGPYTASPLASSTSLPISIQGYTITVGSGGTGGNATADCAARGSVSTFSTITSTGGGGIKSPNINMTGGSGAGAVGQGGPGVGGVGNTPPVSPSQGNNGGNSQATGNYAGGGGGGAGGVGGVGGSPQRTGGAGGAGTTTNINGSAVVRASGGSGGASTPGTSTPATPGGGGRGGAGPTQAGDGTANTGGGGGGGTGNAAPYGGGNGGSGIVIIRYKFQ